MDITIISRKEAKEKGLKHYYTGVPCKRGHIDKRLTSSTTCSECVRENHYMYYEKHKEQALSCIKNWSQQNKDNIVEASRRYRKNNPSADSNNHQRWYNKPEKKEHHLKYTKWWRSINKYKVQQYNATRRAQIRQAMPSWANADLILAVYKDSVRLSNETGIIHHVDHIIPLVNDLVCGLHVHQNLQVLVGSDNTSKSNKFIVD